MNTYYSLLLMAFAIGCTRDASLSAVKGVQAEPASDTAETSDPAPPEDTAGTEAAVDAEAPPGMVRLAGGTFDMGCTPAPDAQGECIVDEYPAHAVTLGHDFWMDEREVTQGAFEAMMGFNPSEVPECGPDCPAECVSWHSSAAFANAKSLIEGREACYTCEGSGTHLGGGECQLAANVSCTLAMAPYECDGYRLPTEAEWEYGARCGTDLLYSGSDDASAVAWCTETSGGSTHPVGLLPPNACGLYDMTGNVFEWNSDWYANDYFEDSPESDPTGPEDGDFRSCRGGGWRHAIDDGHGHLRVAARINRPADLRDRGLGFRLVLTVP